MENNNNNNNNTYIDIHYLELLYVLYALWKYAKPAAFYDNMKALSPTFDFQKCEEYIQSDKKFDYLFGRAIKTDFNNMEKVNTKNYNDYWGVNAFENVIEKLNNNEEIIDSNLEPEIAQNNFMQLLDLILNNNN